MVLPKMLLPELVTFICMYGKNYGFNKTNKKTRILSQFFNTTGKIAFGWMDWSMSGNSKLILYWVSNKTLKIAILTKL